MDKTGKLTTDSTISLSDAPYLKECLIDLAVLPEYRFNEMYKCSHEDYMYFISQFSIDELESVILRSMNSLLNNRHTMSKSMFLRLRTTYINRLSSLHLIYLHYEKDFSYYHSYICNWELILPN